MQNPPSATGARPSAGGLRLLRAGAVASTVFGLAAGAHVLAGGVLPNLFLLAGIAVVLVAGCLLLAGRRFSVPVLAVVLGGGQLALHSVFGVCASATLTVTSTGHHQEFVVGPAVTGSAGASGATSGFMTLAHVVATLVAVGLLGYGEQVLWQLWAWLQPLVRVLLRLVRFVAARVSGIVTGVRPRPRSTVARRVRRRGPPRVLALATTT